MQSIFLTLALCGSMLSAPPQVRDTVVTPAAGAMKTEVNSTTITNVVLEADFIVCGGGLAGVCAAVSAARHGASVILVQDRPMLGGNASSETRMGIVGVKNDEDMEAGILEELQLKNFYFNPLQRYTIWDDIMYSTVVEEPRIKLLLNTSVDGVEMNPDGSIAAVNSRPNSAKLPSRAVTIRLWAILFCFSFARQKRITLSVLRPGPTISQMRISTTKPLRQQFPGCASSTSGFIPRTITSGG